MIDLYLKNILLVTEIIIILLFIIPIFSGIINPGNIAGILISGILLNATIFHKRLFDFTLILWKHTIGKIILTSTFIIILSAAVYALTLTVFMISAKLDKPETPYAVIVLGCKVNGDKPSKMLKRRLDSAADYLKKNESVICIVSGGKGIDEKISEADAMKIYLSKHGIDPDRIITEDKSINTYENIKNSLGILKNNTCEIAIVTDGFHQYRAGYIAGKMGYNASAINAQTNINSLSLDPTYHVREWMAITNEYLRQYRAKQN